MPALSVPCVWPHRTWLWVNRARRARNSGYSSAPATRVAANRPLVTGRSTPVLSKAMPPVAISSTPSPSTGASTTTASRTVPTKPNRTPR